MLKQTLVRVKKIFVPCEENGFKSTILASNFLTYFLVGLIILKLASFGFLMEFSKTGLFAEVSRTALVEMLNTQRQEEGIGILTQNEELNQAAMLKAQHMLSEDYFSHNSPSGISPWFWFKTAGYDYNYAGENLGIGFLDSGEIHQAWNDSSLHKENLLNPNYKEIGIAILRGNLNGEENTVVVQLFGAQKASQGQLVALAEDTQQVVEGIAEEASVETNSIVENVDIKVEAPTQKAREDVLAGATSIIGNPTNKNTNIQTANKSFKLRFFAFMANEYDNLLDLFTFYSLVVVTILLLMNIFIRMNIQHGRLTCKVFGVLMLLLLCIYLNKEVVLKFIPHTVSVYGI